MDEENKLNEEATEEVEPDNEVEQPETEQPENTNDVEGVPNAFSTPEFDASEITRKLDGILETQAMLSKAVAELMQGRGNQSSDNAAGSTRPENAEDSSKPIDVINNLDLN